jgi:hypothetical protein
MSEQKVPESDEVAGHMYRLAQAARLIRFCQEFGFDIDEAMAGNVDLTPIEDANGKIEPEAVDFEAVERPAL